MLEGSGGHIESAQEINNLMHKHKRTQSRCYWHRAVVFSARFPLPIPKEKKGKKIFLKLFWLTLSLNLLSSQTPDQNTNVQYVNTVQDLRGMEQ